MTSADRTGGGQRGAVGIGPAWLGVRLVAWLALCFGAAAVGGWLTAQSLPDWYPTLVKPEWNPPAWIFGPVWTALYAMMAVAAWWATRRAPRVALDGATWIFLVQLALNVAWSGIFFTLRAPGWAMVEIVLLWVAIVATQFVFARRSPLAAALLVPYLVWVTFAAVLNFRLWQLNG